MIVTDNYLDINEILRVLFQEKPQEVPEPEVDDTDTKDLSCRVILYNDDWHTFDEVIVQLIKATGCTFEQARGFAFEVHVKGKAYVFNGTMAECLRVSSILEEIGLHTQIVTE
ncbi:MAG: Clp protease adaptor protein ClpS [Melioribacteraceae bacterium]|nr:MAG: Clp protease adaptor protein ClpS [Melioribacteraceae bacterium]